MPLNTPSTNPTFEEYPLPKLTVNTGVVEKDTTVRYQEEPTPSIYVDYQVNNHFERDHHIYMAGMTSPTPFNGQSVAFFQLAAPTLLWIADWTTARFFQQPDIPDPNAVSSEWILMDGHFVLHDIKPAKDGISPLFRITGTYVFGIKNPGSTFTDGIVYPKPAWLSVENDLPRTIEIEKLKPGIITPVQSILRTKGIRIPTG